LRDESLRLELAPSAALAVLILIVHAAAAFCAAAVLPRTEGLLLAAALLGLGLTAAWSRALLRSKDAVRAIELAPESRAVLEPRLGDRVAAEIGSRRYVSRFMVTLSVTRPGRRTLLITRDMLTADSFRRLRLWALWGKLPRVAPKQLAG
jgi:hypothetical protein